MFINDKMSVKAYKYMYSLNMVNLYVSIDAWFAEWQASRNSLEILDFAWSVQT